MHKNGGADPLVPRVKVVQGGLRDGIRTLPYLGGKANLGGAGPWIADMLSRVEVDTYVEPCAGALGILLRRERVKCEVANDFDGRIVNFFRVVRDRPKEFADLLMATPYASEHEFDWARGALDNGDPVQRALAVYLVLYNAVPSRLGPRIFFCPNANREPWIPEHVYMLAARLRTVRLLARDMLDILPLYTDRPSTLIYIDPPYPDTAGYDNDIDRDAFIDLVSPRGRAHIAISGYPDSYPELEAAGYERIHRDVFCQIGPRPMGGKQSPRREVLWLRRADGKPWAQNEQHQLPLVV